MLIESWRPHPLLLSLGIVLVLVGATVVSMISIGDVMGRGASILCFKALIECFVGSFGYTDEHVGELGVNLGLKLCLGDRNECLACVDHLVV